MEAGYFLAFSTGLLGGFGHCLGMCGPFTASYVLHCGPRRLSLTALIPQIIFNTGRITTYTFIGSMAGLGGSFLNLAGKIAGLQNAIAIISGVIMVLMGLGISGIIKLKIPGEGPNSLIVRGLKTITGDGTVMQYYPLGLLIGFMPCGLSYSVFIGAAGSGGMLRGGLLALLFGLGTAPALLLFGFAASAIGMRMRGILYSASGLLVVLTGVLFIIRGISLYV